MPLVQLPDAGGSNILMSVRLECCSALPVLPADLVDEAKNFLKEGDMLNLQFFGEKVINVELPKNLYLEVTYTESIVKGDTTSSVLKDATLETGYVTKVPAFIKQGDVISVDTSTGEYRERKK